MPLSPQLSLETNELLIRTYTYKLLSLFLSRKISKEELASLQRTTAQFGDKKTIKLDHVYATLQANWTPEIVSKASKLMGEMKDLEPLERKVAPGPSIGVVLADLSGFYKAFGMKENEDITIDNFAVEAEFMSQLLLREAVGIQKGDQEMLEIVRGAEKKFLTDHLSRLHDYFGLAAKKFSELTPIMTPFQEFLLEELDRYGIRGSKPNRPSETSSDEKGIDCSVQCPYG